MGTAQWGSRQSAPTATLARKTLTPPASAARLQGSWDVTVKVVSSGGGTLKVGEKMTYSWAFKPTCPTGPCPVVVSGFIGGHAFKATLTRSGALYTGTTRAHITHCGLLGGTDVRNTVTLRITVKKGVTDNRAWAARSLAGNMVMSSPYTPAGGIYFCPAQSVKSSLTATADLTKAWAQNPGPSARNPCRTAQLPHTGPSSLNRQIR